MASNTVNMEALYQKFYSKVVKSLRSDGDGLKDMIFIRIVIRAYLQNNYDLLTYTLNDSLKSFRSSPKIIEELCLYILNKTDPNKSIFAFLNELTHIYQILTVDGYFTNPKCDIIIKIFVKNGLSKDYINSDSYPDFLTTIYDPNGFNQTNIYILRLINAREADKRRFPILLGKYFHNAEHNFGNRGAGAGAGSTGGRRSRNKSIKNSRN